MQNSLLSGCTHVKWLIILLLIMHVSVTMYAHVHKLRQQTGLFIVQNCQIFKYNNQISILVQQSLY